MSLKHLPIITPGMTFKSIEDEKRSGRIRHVMVQEILETRRVFAREKQLYARCKSKVVAPATDRLFGREGTVWIALRRLCSSDYVPVEVSASIKHEAEPARPVC